MRLWYPPFIEFEKEQEQHVSVDKGDEDLSGNVTSTIRTVCESNSFCKKQQPRVKENVS